MKYITIIQLILVLIFIESIAYSQQKNEKKEEIEKLQIFFSENNILSSIKDSNAVYAFSFKAVVKKDDKGKAGVVSLVANDSIAYAFFPKWKNLNNVNYGLFMHDRSEAIFIFPFIVEVWNIKLNSYPLNKSYVDIILPALSYKENDDYTIEKRIYFKPFLLKINKTVID